MTPRESGFASNTSISSQVSVLFDMPVMGWSDADDGALLAASRSEPDAFMTLYRRYESAVIGYLLRRDVQHGRSRPYDLVRTTGPSP
jgi:hypothetical protein